MWIYQYKVMLKKTKQKNALHEAIEGLLKRADFLNNLGMYRAALVLYNWAKNLDPSDSLVIAGQAKAYHLAIDAETAHYWKQYVGKPFINA